MNFDPNMEKYRESLVSKCHNGLLHQEFLNVSVINMALTNQCNIHCIMCPFISASSKNKTYFNETPVMLTLEDIKNILRPNSNIVGDEKDNVDERKISFHFMKGETLLNPHLYDILVYIKKIYPNSEITILSNGTIAPVQEDIVKYIDVIGFSLDGSSAEVFDKIRTPSRFSHVINTIHKWMMAGNRLNPKLIFRTSTTLSTLNFRDLPNIVRTVGELAEQTGVQWDSVYCQPVIIEDYQAPSLKNITLDHIDPEQGKAVLQETIKMAEKYGIRLDIPQSIYELFESNNSGLDHSELFKYPMAEVFCEKLRNGYLSYNLNGKLDFACCFMKKKYYRELIERYHIPDKGTPDEIYNSTGYWKLRLDLLNGNLKKECGNCTIGKSNYFTLLSQVENRN